MQDKIWHRRSIQNYNGADLPVYSVVKYDVHISPFCQLIALSENFDNDGDVCYF